MGCASSAPDIKIDDPKKGTKNVDASTPAAPVSYNHNPI